MRRGVSIAISWGLLVPLIMLASPQAQGPGPTGKGQLVGYVFGQDGSTPVAGVVVVAKNVTTGTLVRSSKTDRLGIFKFENLAAGIYAVGVTSEKGDYNSQELVGVKPDETAKITISLNPYEREALAAAQAVAREEKERGESLVGRVVTYSQDSKEAIVMIERGLIQVGDRVRVRGGKTNFAQDVKVLRVGGTRVKMCLSGEQGLLPVLRPCVTGDKVYIICKRGVPPVFLAPLGLAAIVAGSATLVTLEEEESVSPTKPVKIKD